MNRAEIQSVEIRGLNNRLNDFESAVLGPETDQHTRGLVRGFPQRPAAFQIEDAIIKNDGTLRAEFSPHFSII